jgi:hypothetical protein
MQSLSLEYTTGLQFIIYSTGKTLLILKQNALAKHRHAEDFINIYSICIHLTEKSLADISDIL